MDQLYGADNYVWVQDGTPAHSCNAVQQYLECLLGSRGFWSKDVWLLSSPNLNPLDFSIWMHIEQNACASTSSNVDELECKLEAA